jgi:hypothetical protein
MKQRVSVIIVLIVVLIGAVGYFAWSKKVISPVIVTQQIIRPGQNIAFEEAINKSDFDNIGKYFADKVYVVLEGSSCCGEVTASRAVFQELERIKGIKFTFNPNDSVVKEYMDYMATEYPNRRFTKKIPKKVYFDEYVIGVESDISQKNKATIGYIMSNGKITDLFIDKGRDEINK